MFNTRSFLLAAITMTTTFSAVSAQPGETPNTTRQPAPNRAENLITASDLLRLRTITKVEVAPDGNTAVYALRSIHTRPSASEKPAAKPSYDYRTHLWRIDLRAADPVPEQLTHADRDDSDPTISPDGRWLAFVRKDASDTAHDKSPDERKPQVWVLPLDSPGEARQITTLKHGAASPAWRPDSRALLVTSSIPASELEGEPSYPHERPGRDWRDYDHRLPGDDSKDPAPASPDGDLRAVRNWLEKNAADADPVVLTRLAFQEELALRKEDRFSHIFSLDLEGDAEPVQLTRGFHNHTDPQWDPRSRFIVFVTDSVADVHPDRVRRTAIFRVRPDGTGVESWLNDSGLILTSPRFNGNGTGITCVATEFEDRIYKQSYLLFVLVDRPGWFNTVEGWDSHASNPRWFDLETLLFTTPHHGADHIMMTDAGVRDDELERITAGPVSTLAYDTKAGVIVAALATPQNPCELFLLPDGAPPRRLTDLHHSWLESKELAAFEEHWIDRPDGERVQYWTVKPPAAAGAAPHPVILAIHGGPMAMWGPSEPTMWHEWQLQAAWGYAIVFANPRGSSGYGYDFQRGNHQNWGPGPTGDVLASLDDAIQNNNWIDADRQFITGGSYAGYLTAWIIAHTDRFRAAVAQRGVYDLITFFGEGNAWRLAPEAFGGFPWEPAVRRILSAESPFTYVDQITTPFLIMHGSNDLRTGVTQSEMMYRALKELERPVEYVRYPGAGHDLSRTGKPAQRLDRLMRIIEFFERYDRPATGSSAAN